MSTRISVLGVFANVVDVIWGAFAFAHKLKSHLSPIWRRFKRRSANSYCTKCNWWPGVNVFAPHPSKNARLIDVNECKHPLACASIHISNLLARNQHKKTNTEICSDCFCPSFYGRKIIRSGFSISCAGQYIILSSLRDGSFRFLLIKPSCVRSDKAVGSFGNNWRRTLCVDWIQCRMYKICSFRSWNIPKYHTDILLRNSVGNKDKLKIHRVARGIYA